METWPISPFLKTLGWTTVGGNVELAPDRSSCIHNASESVKGEYTSTDTVYLSNTDCMFTRKRLRHRDPHTESSRRLLRREIDILRTLVPQRHVIPLLMSYTHRLDLGYLTFPVTWTLVDLIDCDEAVRKVTCPDGMLMKSLGCLISGLRYIHDARICHRDIRPANIVYELRNDMRSDRLYRRKWLFCGFDHAVELPVDLPA